jgi:hypothetical protein
VLLGGINEDEVFASDEILVESELGVEGCGLNRWIRIDVEFKLWLKDVYFTFNN